MQLSGELSKVSFPNLLQLVRSGGLTGKITLSQGVKLATIVIESGLPCHVEMEGLTGREALYELFLWEGGTFAFAEALISGSRRTIDFSSPDNTFEKLLKEGLAYIDERRYLDHLGLKADSVLRPVTGKQDFAQALIRNPGLERIDGVHTIEDALSSLNLSRVELVSRLCSWLANGLVEPVRVYAADNQVVLPDWVIARLKQDNPDLSRAIVDMVIWVDRVKCWMYQADADFERVLSTVESAAKGKVEYGSRDAAGVVKRAESGKSGDAGKLVNSDKLGDSGEQSGFGGPLKPPDAL